MHYTIQNVFTGSRFFFFLRFLHKAPSVEKIHTAWYHLWNSYFCEKHFKYICILTSVSHMRGRLFSLIYDFGSSPFLLIGIWQPYNGSALKRKWMGYLVMSKFNYLPVQKTVFLNFSSLNIFEDSSTIRHIAVYFGYPFLFLKL